MLMPGRIAAVDSRETSVCSSKFATTQEPALGQRINALDEVSGGDMKTAMLPEHPDGLHLEESIYDPTMLEAP